MMIGSTQAQSHPDMARADLSAPAATRTIAKISWSAALLLIASSLPSLAEENISTARIVTTPHMALPQYHRAAVDPVFGTRFMRVTAPGRRMGADTRCSPKYCIHRYSSSQAWNADQSLLVIALGCSGLCFLDGQTYQPLFRRKMSGECEWHPRDPTLMICVDRREVYLWSPRSDRKTVIFAPDGYRKLQFGPYKGNPSQNGDRVVIRARTGGGSLVAFAYDIATRMKYPDIDLAALDGVNGYCGISASGKYIFCWQVMPDESNQAYIFTVDGRLVQHWSENHRPGHGDMVVDADGSDVYVGVSKSEPDKYHLIKRRLADGAVTDLASYGEAQHASIRNINRPGWVFVTYTGTYSEVAEHPEWVPFYQEIIALRIDGSGEIKRIVQTRDAKYNYWNEAHASPSPDGSQIIWSSNWGRAGGPVADYVARLTWPASGTPARSTSAYSRATPPPR